MKRAQFLAPWDDPRSPWRTSADVAAYIRKFTPDGRPDIQSAWAFLDSRIEERDKCRRGRVVLFRKSAVEAALGVTA